MCCPAYTCVIICSALLVGSFAFEGCPGLSGNAVEGGVAVQPAAAAECTIRLAGGTSPRAGRVEVYHDGFWGTVCDDNFGEEESRVVCRSLGYDRGTVQGFKYGPGDGMPIWLDEVRCTGRELDIRRCDVNWGVTDCGHHEDVGVECETGLCVEQEGEIRLIDGAERSTGRIVIYHDNQWGTVCNDNFDKVAAGVVCRILNYDVGNLISVGYIGEVVKDMPIWLDEVDCDGHEATLADCRHAGWNVNDCTHAEDQGVRCQNF